MVRRTMMTGLGGMAGLVAWYIAMTTTGLWSIFFQSSNDDMHHMGWLAWRVFYGSLLLCGFGGGALVLFLGERFHLLRSQEELDQQARPVSLFSER